MRKNAQTFNRARGLFVAEMLANEIWTGRKGKGAGRTMMQTVNDLLGTRHRTKRDALSGLVTAMRQQYGYVPTARVRRVLAR